VTTSIKFSQICFSDHLYYVTVKPVLVTTSIKLVKPPFVTTSIKVVKPALVLSVT
jgi:predicted transcriptional regulator